MGPSEGGVVSLIATYYVNNFNHIDLSVDADVVLGEFQRGGAGKIDTHTSSVAGTQSLLLCTKLRRQICQV